jgi:hypothetical protein
MKHGIAEQKAKKHEFGFGFCVRAIFLKYVKDFKITNEKICYLRPKTKWFSCTLINVHSPTYKTMENLKEEFYNLLEQNINQTANSDTKYLEILTQKVGKKTYTVWN